MATPTPAQQEFNDLVAKNSQTTSRVHPEDRGEEERDRDSLDINEEDAYRKGQIDAAMRMPTLDRLTGHSTGLELKLPPASFDAGRTTGVKGVIADARSYETARKTSWISRVKTARKSIFGLEGVGAIASKSESETDDEGNTSDLQDEEAFLVQWRESRRRELENEANRAIRNRRTSPSVRMYGRMDEVDALGYLDAIEKVGRETVVAVFVYDPDCQVSATIESALMPLVSSYPAVHFVKVHYADIEFDNAAVPSILAYRNQGDMFANLTGIIEMIPDDEAFGADTLRRLFQRHNML